MKALKQFYNEFTTLTGRMGGKTGDIAPWFYTDEEIIWMNRKRIKAVLAYRRKQKRTKGVINSLKLRLNAPEHTHTENYDENPLTAGKDYFLLGQRGTRKFIGKKMWWADTPDDCFYETNPILEKAWWCIKSKQPCFERAKNKGKHCQCENCQAFVYSLWAIHQNELNRQPRVVESNKKSVMSFLTILNGSIILALILRELPRLMTP